MRCKSVFALLCAAATLAGCASNSDQPTTSAGQGMLVIGVVLNDMNDAGQVDGGRHAVNFLSVKDLDDGQVYDILLTSNHGVATLPAGTYCVNSLMPRHYASLSYCAKPFFKVAAGKILVAGYFEFALDMPTHSYTLVNSFTNPQGLFDSLSQSAKHRLASFSRNQTTASN